MVRILMVPNYFAIFGIMVFSLVFAGITTLIVLGIAEDEVIESLRLNTKVISREELRMLLTVICFIIFTGVIEGFVVGTKGIILAFESLPLLIVLFSGLIKISIFNAFYVIIIKLLGTIIQCGDSVVIRV
jgi:hypothetical protein